MPITAEVLFERSRTVQTSVNTSRELTTFLGAEITVNIKNINKKNKKHRGIFWVRLQAKSLHLTFIESEDHF